MNIRFFAALLLISAAAPSWAIHKCTAPDGKVTYQEHPCGDGKGTEINVGNAGKPRSPLQVLPTPPARPASASEKKAMSALSEEELKTIVRASLKDPDSAKFQDLQYVDGRALCGQVNAKNSYGGYTGFKLFIADAEGVYWSGDGSSQSDMNDPKVRRTFWPKLYFWNCHR